MFDYIDCGHSDMVFTDAHFLVHDFPEQKYSAANRHHRGSTFYRHLGSNESLDGHVGPAGDHVGSNGSGIVRSSSVPVGASGHVGSSNGHIGSTSGHLESRRISVGHIRSLSRHVRRRRGRSTLDEYVIVEKIQPLEGQLYKYTNVVKGWQFRWFALDPNTGMLEYFEKEEQRKNRPRGSVFLAGAVISPSDEDSQTFTVHAANGEVYRLKAFDAKERQHWVNRIRATAEFHLDTLAQNYPPVAVAASSESLNSHTSSQSTPRPPVIRSLDTHPPTSLQRILHPDKPGIVHEVKPKVDVFHDVKETLQDVQYHSSELDLRIEDLPHLSSLDKDILLLKATSHAAMACLQQCLNIMTHQKNSNSRGSARPGHHIEWLTDRSRSSSVTSAVTSSRKNSHGSLVPVPPPTQLKAEPVSINHDSEEEDEREYSDTALDGVEEHKSVILHLLSQLKLGMDLTKVVLPTFILEKRSLLEMFADCMAHPDYFIKITDRPDPESRMLAVVEWYLTSFHVSRTGSIAKKPYNPVIGEHFHCSWNITDSSSSPTSSSSSSSTRLHGNEQTQTNKQPSNDQNGRHSNNVSSRDKSQERAGSSAAKTPTNENQDGFHANGTSSGSHGNTGLYYCAEQVSHHPPVSAVYFECPSKQIWANGAVWTKSKFMGMSIGVVFVGKISIHLLEWDEVYTFSLPSAYARSILTVPWVELGDKINISCQKTGYNASVTFHTKPFYGGKLHRVTAEVKNVTSQQTCCRVSGEWNGSLEFSYSNGESKVIDTSTLTSVRKRVRPLHKQHSTESRALWKNVTEALVDGDLIKATEQKREIEERQREGERARIENNLPFPTRYFHPEGDTWVYNTPLKKGDFKGSA